MTENTYTKQFKSCQELNINYPGNVLDLTTGYDDGRDDKAGGPRATLPSSSVKVISSPDPLQNPPDSLQDALPDDTSLDTNRLSRQGCGQKMVKLKCTGCGEIHYKLYECGHRLCPACAKKRSRDIFWQIFDVIEQIKVPYGMGYKLITLTIKKTTFEVDVLTAMQGIGKIYHNILEKLGIGAVAQLELSPTGEVHWHILYLGRYIPQALLSNEWKRITGHSIIVDIRQLNGHKGIKGAILEVTKYIMKFADIPDGMQWAYYQVIKNRRVFRTFGVFYGKVGKKPVLMCMWCGGADWEYLGKDDINDFTWHQWYAQNRLREKWRNTG